MRIKSDRGSGEYDLQCVASSAEPAPRAIVSAVGTQCLRYATAQSRPHDQRECFGSQAGTCGASLVSMPHERSECFGYTWAFVVAEVHRILNKTPRTADADRGVFYLEAWRGPSPRAQRV